MDQAHAGELLDQFIPAGGLFLDTACCYCDRVPGASEAVSERLATCSGQGGAKTSSLRPKADLRFQAGGDRPAAYPADIEIDFFESLSNQQIDLLDLYWVHQDDERQPVQGIAVIGFGRDNGGKR